MNLGPAVGTDRGSQTLLPREQFESLVAVFESAAPQLLISGPPSVGKSVIARAVADAVATPGVSDRVRFLQIHPGTRREDLVGGLAAFAIDGRRVWEQLDGPLVAMAGAVRADGARRVLVLDDMHHVDVPSLFGETLVLLDKRDHGSGEPSVARPHGPRMSLPRGLGIIATSLPTPAGDPALTMNWHRRFASVDLPPSSEILERHYETATNDVDDLLDGFDWMNVMLKAAFGAAGTIGHGVFMVDHMTPKLLRRIWDQQVGPTLAVTTLGHPIAQRLAPEVLWPKLAA